MNFSSTKINAKEYFASQKIGWLLFFLLDIGKYLKSQKVANDAVRWGGPMVLWEKAIPANMDFLFGCPEIQSPFY